MGDDTTYRFRVEERQGYIFVWQTGLAKEVAEIEAVQQAIEAAMAKQGTRWVLFDNRDTLPPDEWVRGAMWSWLAHKVTRAALLQRVARNVRRADRTGERNRISLRAFSDEPEAVKWLMSAKAHPPGEGDE